MLRIGTIGTGMIVSEFINACRENKEVEFTCLYSRSLDKAKIFSLKNNLQVRMVDNFEEMLDYIDIIYIASPNGLHYQQAKYFLQQQKHVLLEKPATFLQNEIIDLKNIALMNNVILMEAFKPIHLPEFQILKKTVDEIKPFLANFNWSKYSSRMKDVLNDEYPSIFDEILGRGSLYDALIYPVELAGALFGPIKEVKAMSHKLKNGVDINNIVLLRHQNNIFTSIVCSKATNGKNDSEILSYDYTITFNNLTSLNNLALHSREQDDYQYLTTSSSSTNKMVYELNAFLSLINTNNFKEMERLLDLTINAIAALEAIDRNQNQQGEFINEIK
ncbi:Gfo/Idh/MocA family protein [Spiroplasma chrysopicola]|uniref:Oxidoreductase n=1 Tax=Spiroplasma chrysopicola DF-1 TaxID=1276227 RepID=R4UBM3_9MOLU|nr:Gfo/Idh/MocA family oxidoreductase [Spiroplasma chrysopicola]AGM25309.1 oxidoreductase [Spiroplasma chrysopicola DF-1]